MNKKGKATSKKKHILCKIMNTNKLEKRDTRMRSGFLVKSASQNSAGRINMTFILIHSLDQPAAICLIVKLPLAKLYHPNKSRESTDVIVRDESA